MKLFASRTMMAALAVGGAISAQATIYEFNDTMSGLQEVPPNASPATGTASGMYDDSTRTLHIEVNVTGLVAPSTAAHIHNAPVGVSGPVIFPFTGVTGSTTYFTHDVFVLNAAQETQFLTGRYYANVHSTAFPGGEVRGQLHPTPVPEPASLLALGLGAVALMIRRRRD